MRWDKQLNATFQATFYLFYLLMERNVGITMPCDNPHGGIDHVFKDLLPSNGMTERPEQIALAHQLLDAMLDKEIALCDAGTGIGKTYAFLVAGLAFLRFRLSIGLPFQPIIISTSSIALQEAVQKSYLPFLSRVLLADGMISKPIQSVIRKGKKHYVCVKRLAWRLRSAYPPTKDSRYSKALQSLTGVLDMDAVGDLKNYDRERVCVPEVCDCDLKGQCRYYRFIDDCNKTPYLFQICNHNLMLADLTRRAAERKPILPDSAALVVDEAHKLPETLRQTLELSLEAEDVRAMIRMLRDEDFKKEADGLSSFSGRLLEALDKPPQEIPFEQYARLLVFPGKVAETIYQRQKYNMTLRTRRQTEKLLYVCTEFVYGEDDYIFYAAPHNNGGTVLQAAPKDLPEHFEELIWNLPEPILLTSGTLAANGDFRRFREKTGLDSNRRLSEAVFPSPFNYRDNCLLYFPKKPLKTEETASEEYYDALTKEIQALVQATSGHALVLFTSYDDISAMIKRLKAAPGRWPISVLNRNDPFEVEKFKSRPGGVLLATGAAWEGFDFPGDCVSLLIIPKLPFAYPDAVSEFERTRYDDLPSYIRAVALPDMLIKLRQGYGRAVRTETDTCVIAILDGRAAPGGRYYRDVIKVLPETRRTRDLREVRRFIQNAKPYGYFREP